MLKSLSGSSIDDFDAVFSLSAFGVISGYAVYNNNPDLSLTLEIYCDGALIGLSRSDKERPVTENKKQYFHGFYFEVNQKWLSPERVFSIKIANTDIRFPVYSDLCFNSNKSIQRFSESPSSQVLYNGGGIIRGWVRASSKNNSQKFIDIICDNEYLMRCLPKETIQWTTGYQEELAGFRIELPLSLFDGSVHIIALFDENKLELHGSPFEVCLFRNGIAETITQSQEISKTDISDQDTRLTSLIHYLEEKYPKSIGFNFYADWLENFNEKNQTKCASATILLLFIDQADKEFINNELNKYKKANGNQLKISYIICSPKNIVSQISQNIDDFDFIFPIWSGSRYEYCALSLFVSEMRKLKAPVAYSDSDYIDSHNGQYSPWFKPAWDETLFMTIDYLSNGLCLSSSGIKKVFDQLRRESDPRYISWDLFLLLLTRHYHNSILHIPKILYSSKISFAESKRNNINRITALNKYFTEIVKIKNVDILIESEGQIRLKWTLPKREPRVSIIIPTRDSYNLIKNCIDSITAITDYSNYELIIIDNQSTDIMTRSYLDRLSGNIAQIIPYDHPFNYSDMHNQIIHHCSGDILCFMNNDISVFQKDWLREMISHLIRQGVGAVGAKLLWPNDMVQHGGVVVGVDGLAAHTGNYYNRHDHGYFDINISVREQSAVTAACMLLKKSDFISVGGFDPKLFPIAFNDVDLCLRLRKKGLKIIWTPYAELYHLESASRGKDLLPSQSARSKREQLNFIQQWTEREFYDPYYNPNLSLDYLSGPYQGLRLSSKKIVGRFNQ